MTDGAELLVYLLSSPSGGGFGVGLPEHLGSLSGSGGSEYKINRYQELNHGLMVRHFTQFVDIFGSTPFEWC
jgi:hypothetical protein